MAEFRTTVYEFGEYRLDPAAGCVTRRGDLIPLPPKAIDVLLELVRRPGSIVSKHFLMDTVWPDTFVEEANLNQMVFLLRRAFGSASGYQEIITTVPRRGYRLAIDVRRVETPCRIASIAVLPLVNLSGNPDEEYFADGITESLITNLARIRALRVVSRTSAMRYKGARVPIADIGRALRVDAVVEGSAIRSGDKVRVTIQLIHAATDQHLWADTYDGEANDVLALQNHVARAVATKVSAQLTPDEKTRLGTSRRVDPEAYSQCLKGRFFARHLTESAQRRAIQYFENAIHLDPEYAAPHAGLAECLTTLAFFFGMEPKEAFSAAKPAAIRATVLDPPLAEAHAVLGLLRLLDDWDWEGGETESRRAVELAPGDAYVQWRRGAYLQYAGRVDEAVEAHRRAESLDPFSLLAIEEAGWPLYYSRRFDEAVAQFHKAIELSSDWAMPYFGLGLARTHQSEHHAAVAALERAVALSGPNAIIEATLCYVYGRAGQLEEAARRFARLKEHAYVPRWFLAIVHLGLGELDAVLDSLEQAFCDCEPCMVTLHIDPIFDPLRSDVRFRDLLGRIRPNCIEHV